MRVSWSRVSEGEGEGVGVGVGVGVDVTHADTHTMIETQ
jgi:hypothetical protein